MRTALCFLFFGMMAFPGISAATTLTGVVIDAVRSMPLPGAAVFVDILIPDSMTISTSSDSTGMYTLPGIPDGNAIYVIRCSVAGFAPFYMRYDALGLGDRKVDILMYPQAAPPGGGGDSTGVSGLVLHETTGGARQPVDQAMVTLRSAGNQVSSRTGTDGQYSIRVRKASYSVSVEAPNFETLTAGGVAVDSAGLTLNILLIPTAVSASREINPGPESYALENAYPNPFNPVTIITYQLPVADNVRLTIVDLLGHEMRVLVDERSGAGKHQVRFEASGLPSGTYFCRLVAGDRVLTRRILLLR